MTSSLDLFTARNIEDPSPLSYQYSSNFTGLQLLTVGSFNVGLQINTTNVVKFLDANGQTKILNPDLTLQEQGLKNGMTVFILPQDDNSILPIREIPDGNSNTFDSKNIKTDTDLVSISDLPKLRTFTSSYQAYNSVSDFNFSDHTDASDGSEFGTLKISDLAKNFGIDTHDSGKSVTILTYDGFRSRTNLECIYFLHFSYHEMCETARKFLGLPKKKYVLLMRFSDEESKWFEPGHYLEEYNPFNNMKMFVFTTKIQLRVITKYLPPVECVVELMKTVKEIIPEIAKQLGMDSYYAYSLYKKKNHDINQHELLEDELSLPQQTRSIREVLFLRRFFIFTGYDLVSFTSAFNAFRDAREEFLYGKLHCDIKQVIVLASYSLLIDPPDGYEFDFSMIPETISNIVPKNFASNPAVREGIKTFFNTREKPNRGDAIRIFLRIIRLIPSFAAERYKAKLQIHEKNGSNYIDCQLFFCPHRLIITITDDQEIDNEIYYQKITESSIKSHKITIKYRKQPRIYDVVVLRSKYADEIYSVLSGFESVFKSILQRRAIERAHETGDDVSLLDEEDQIGLFTQLSRSDDANPQLFIYDRRITGGQLIIQAMKNLNLNVNVKYSILFQIRENTFKWIKPNETLFGMNIDDGMIAYMIEINARLRLHLTDESSKMVIYDVTKPVRELVKLTFEKLHMSEIVGYTFFFKNNPQKALDTRFSIPEQCTEYSDLIFKRRFFILTVSDLINIPVLRQTYHDTKYYVLNQDVEINEDQAIDLGILSVIIDTPVNGDVRQTFGHTDFEGLFPKQIKITQKFTTKFHSVFKSFDITIEECAAMRRYIKLARDLPKFGSETVKTNYKLLGKNKKSKFFEGQIIVCPLFLILEDITSKKEVFKIYYHQIISYKSADKAMTLTFIDSKGVNSTTYGFKSENLDTILMLISETIGILRKSIIDRQNEKAAENLAIKQRLDGGWVDENGRVRRKMIDMRLSLSLTKETNLPLYWFEVELTKEELIELLVRNNRKLDPKKSYSLLAKMINRNPKFRFLKKGEKISDINPTRDFLMFIIESNLILKITTLLHQVKSILIPIEKNIKELIPIIAEKFALTNCIGYTLFSTDNNSQKPLELYLTIPEQMSEFQIILLKRRFFVITTKDYAHMGSMLTTFNDVRDLILSGKMDVPVGDALKLAYYALYIDLPRIPSPEDIPKDIQSLLPINISSKSSYIKILKNYCTTPIDNIVNSREMAIRKYLDISRSIPTFGCEPFQATMQDKKNKIVKITLLVGPTKLFGRKTNGKYFLTIGYDHIIKISSINKQILIKYHDESLNQFTYFEFECEKSQEFLDVQRTYVEISDEVLLSRIPSAGNITESLYISNLDRIELQIEYRNSGETIHCPYDKRLNGLQLAQKVSHNLKKNPNGQYTCLLELSPEDKIWVKPTQILGMLHPFKHAKLHLFENNMLVSITPDDGISRKVIIDITQTVSDLISFIADRLYVDNWIGYCLYSSNGEPLDYQKSVPEQINDFSNLIFKRRLFRVTKYDIETPNIALRLFSDFRKNALSNICKPTENQVIAMATLLLYADGKSPEEVQKNQLSKNMHDIEYILPQGYNPRSDLIRKIEKIKSDKLFNKTEAMIKFIHDTKNIKYFGYEQFLRVSVLTQNKKNREVNILIGPKGVKIYHYATHEENDIKYKQILEINIMKDIILLKVVADGNGDKDKVVDFLFMANTAERIYNLIDAYRNIIIPQLKARKQLQKGSESINTDILDPNTILLEVSRQMGHPHPLHYAFDLDETGIIISNQLINVFLLINSTKNQILHRSPEGELSWLPDNGKFRTLNPTIGSRIFFTQLNTPVKVIISNNLIIQSIISIQEFISKNVQVIISDLNNKFFEGFTLYPLAPERLIPLSLNKSLPEQTTSFTELYIRRRFYVFPSLLFDDNNSVFMLYDDCKRMVMNEEVELNEEKALDLAYFTIYADLNEKSFFLSPTIFEDLSPFIPPSIISSSNLINKFKTLIKQFPPMSELEAAYHYIEQCVVLHGFGCEIYECFYNDVINSNKRQHRISKLYLGPFLIEVIDFQSHRKYAYFDYSSIITYFIENGNLHFKYFDDDKNENHIMLEIDHVEEAHEYVKQMFVYFADDYYLRSPSEIINEINFKLAKKASQVHTTENSNYRISYTQEDDYSQDYQDLSLDVNAESYDCCYSIPDINDDDNDEYHYIDRPVDMYGNDDNYKWRMDQDGLKIDRIGRMLDALDDELHDVIDKLNEMNYDTLIDKFAVIENLVNTLRESDISDKFKQKVDKMDSLINEIRETIDKFDGNEGDMRFYVGVLTEKFTAMMNDVIPMKKLIIGERQLKITMENITDPLVRNVIDVSEALEELAASLSRSLRNFNGIDPKSYINTIHVMSERLTALASSLSDTKDPNFVEGSIVPALQETTKLLEKLPSLGISNPLSDNIIRMIVSIEKMIANTAESRNKTSNLMYCGDNKAIHTSISALLMVSSAVEKYIESPLHKTNILTAQLISTTKIRIFEAKQVVSNQMKLMKNDFSNATFRYRSLYAILSAEKLSKQLIEHLSDNQAQVSKEENILNYLDTSIKAITTINMIPSNIGLILQNIDLILTYHTKIKPGILEKQLSNIECIIIAETIAVLKEIHFNIQQHQNELDQNFLDSNIIRLVQSQLLKLRGLIFKLKTSLKAIEKCTNDPTCSVLLERLIMSLNSTMCEQMPSESIDTSRHLASFIQTQHDLGILINSIYKSMNNPNINSHIRSNMQQSLKISQNSYIEMIKIRRELNETPYDSDTIKQAMIQLTKVHNMLEYFIDYSRQYSEKTLDMELQRCTSVTLRNIKNTIDDLNNAPACIFRVPPSSKDIESLIKIIHELESSYDDNSQMKLSLKKQISKLQNEKLLPSDNFFRIVQRILNKISKIPSSHNQELLSKTINELKLFLNYKKPTLADVKALSLAAIAAYDDFIHNIKSRNDQPCYKSWEVTIQNQINSILTIINNTSSEQFNYQSSLLVKEAFMNIKTQLPYIPNSLRDIIDMQIFENLATKLGKAHAHGNKIINCVRNLPTSSVVKIDIHKFRLIQNDDELDDSFLIWREQVNYLNSIVNECSNMPQIATQIHTQNLLSKIVSTLKNILDMKYSNENEMIKFLGFFKDQMQFMENSINLISPILGSPNLPDICLILSQNAILLHRLLISPHMKENESNAFINEFKICFSSLLNLIPKCNQSVQSHIKDLNTIIFGISNIDTIGLRKRQILCDTLYMHVTTILPKIFNAIDSDEIIDELLKLYEITGRYKSVQTIEIKFTSGLHLNSTLLSDETISNVVQQGINYCNGKFSPELSELIIDNLAFINDHQEIIPEYIYNSSFCILPTISSIKYPMIMTAVRCITSLQRNFSLKLDHLIEISINISIRTGKIVNNIKNTLQYIDQQILSSPHLFNEVALNQFNQLMRSLSYIDTKMLTQCKSLATTVLSFLPMQDFESDLLLFLNSAKDLLSLRSIILPLNDSLSDFCFWLNETELSISSIFLSCMDFLVCQSEEKNETGMMPFFRRATQFLLSKERLFVAHKVELRELSKLFLQYPNMYPNETLSIFEKLLPIIKWWSNLSNNENSLNIFISNSMSINGMLDRCKYLAKTAPTQLIASFSIPKSKITRIIAENDKTNIISEIIKEIEKLLEMNLTLTQIDSIQKCINQILSQSQSMLRNQISKYNLSSIVNQANRDIDLITKKKYVDIANEILNYLKELISRIEAKNSTNSTEKKHYIETRYVPILSYGMMSIINTNEKDQTNNILSYDFATLNSILYGTMVNLFSVQKYQLLKLVLSDMFPDTIKSKYIDSKSIKSDDFDFAFMYTEQQFDLVFDKKALNELQSRFTHNDVLIQQYIISCCINSYSSFGEDNINISNQYLLTLFTQIKNGKPIKKISISKYLNYQISVIRLLSQLLSLLLLLPNDSFLRYINTSEGQRHTFSHAYSHDILKCQQIIQQLIMVSSFPNVITLTINQLSHEQILLIIKLIIHSIAMIQNGKFENAPDSITIFRALNIQQLKLFKENPEELLSSEYISIQAINNSHQILLDLMKRFIISTSLFSIWFHNKASNDTKEPTDTDIKIEIDLIIKNISSLNIGVNSLLTPDEKEKYANVSLHLLCLLLNHKLLFTNSENIYVPYKSITHPKMHLLPKSINNIILFDSLLQVFSHIEDSLLMLSFHSKYTKNDIQKENAILLDEFLSILNNTPSKINEFIDAHFSNSLYTTINQEIISCNSNQLTDNITLVANQSNILNKIVICFQQYIDHSFSKFFSKDDIGNLVDKYLLLYKLSSISEILDRFDVKPNHLENIEINKDFIVETIEKQLKIIESTKSQQLYTMMKKMTPNERSNEKFVLISLIKNIKEDTNFVRVNLQKLISKLDLNIESCEITVSQTQYHQYLLAQKLQIILDKTMKGNMLDNHHNQDILLTFSQNELHEFYKITRILIGNPNSNIDINFKYFEFLKHAIKILCSDYDILSSHITVPSFSISSYLNITPIPTYYTLLSKYAHSIHSLIHLFSTYSQLPDKECMLILNSENKSAIELMKSQIISEQILPSIHKICDILPQMIASLIVVFDQKQTNDTLKPLSLFSDIETLLESSLGDDKLYDFRKSLLRLQSKFSNLQAITDPEFFSNDKRCIDCVVGLIISIDKMDLKAFNSILIELEAIKTNSVKTGIPIATLEPIWKELHLISPIAISSYGKSFLFDTEMKEKVSKLRPILIDILNKRINNPFAENEKLTSSHNISLLLKECLNSIINGEKTLVKLIGTQFDDSKFSISQAINDIVVHFTSAIASSIKNLEMIKDEKISNYTDFYEILPTAINSLKQLMEIKNDSSPTHTSTRRLIRPMKRVINSLLDQIDDLNDRIPQDYRKNNDITCEKLEYAKNVSDILMKSLLTVATNSSSIIPDTFTEFLKTGNQSEKYHQSILNIQNIGKCLIKLNVDKAAESEFHSEMTHLSDELYKFNSIISSQKQISSDKMIESFTDLALFLMKSFRKSLLLTDIQAESPDFDNAARIPNHYFMPKVPNDSLQFKLQENISKLKLDLDKYKGKSNEFTIAQTSSNNTKLTDIMISLIKIMDSLLENLLRVTATTMSLKYQTSLANNASGISSNFSTIVKSFRNKLLLIGDWSSSYPKYFLIIDNLINDIIMKCEEAYKVAEAEEKTRDMNVIKINKSLKLIKDTEAILIAQKNPIENIISSNQKEWSIQILNIGLSLSNSFEKVLLHAKENAKKDYQTILSLSDSMCTNISEISKIIANTINNNDRSIEGDINKVMLSIASSANEYGNWKASSKEELAMKNGILIICRAANSVADMVMMASNAKNAAQERKRIASDQQRLLQSTASKDRLLKRLELESKVIKYRIVLAKSEQILADIH